MIAVGEEKLNLKDVISILYDNTKIELTDTLINKAESNFNFLRDFSKDKVIYGINTGFGPMAQYRIPCLLYTSEFFLPHRQIPIDQSNASQCYW